MARDILREEYITSAASESDYGVEEVRDAVRQIHDAVQANLLDHYERCWLSGGLDYHLYDIDDEVWFALGEERVVEDLRDQDTEISPGLRRTALAAFRDAFQANGDTITLYRNIAERRTDPMFYPVCVQKSEEWVRGEQHTMQMFEAFVSRSKMSAAEALDYWATEFMDEGAATWCGKRDVSAEAVRKNRRQAQEKMAEYGFGDEYDVNDIHVDKAENGPDEGVFDEGSERYYVPIGGRLTYEEE